MIPALCRCSGGYRNCRIAWLQSATTNRSFLVACLRKRLQFLRPNTSRTSVLNYHHALDQVYVDGVSLSCFFFGTCLSSTKEIQTYLDAVAHVSGLTCDGACAVVSGLCGTTASLTRHWFHGRHDLHGQNLHHHLSSRVSFVSFAISGHPFGTVCLQPPVMALEVCALSVVRQRDSTQTVRTLGLPDCVPTPHKPNT